MYIIELIAKLINKRDEKKEKFTPPEVDYDDLCEHVFFPIDSTNETLACSKCGFIIKNDPDKVKPRNPFYS